MINTLKKQALSIVVNAALDVAERRVDEVIHQNGGQNTTRATKWLMLYQTPVSKSLLEKRHHRG